MICTQIPNKRENLKCGKTFGELAEFSFFVFWVTSEQGGRHQSNSLIQGKMTTQSASWSAIAFKQLFSSLVERSQASVDAVPFICRGLLNRMPRSNEILSLQNKIEITFWWLNAKLKISNLATWNLNTCNFFSPFLQFKKKKKAVWHKSLILSLMYEEGESCLNVDQTQLYCMTREAEKKYFHQPQSVPRKGLFSLLLPVMGLTFPSMAVSCHLKLS